MKRRIMDYYVARRTHIAFMAVLTAMTTSALSSEPATVRLLTFNIHHGRGADDDIDLTRIAKTIKASRADLVALQEVDRGAGRSQEQDQSLKLSELTGLNHAFGKAIDFDGGQYGVAVLSRYPIASSKTLPLPSSKDREQRVALEVRVPVPEFSPLIFVCTHLDHHSDEKDRMAQATKLLDLFSHGPSAAILAGDLNATPDSNVLRTLGKYWQIADERRQFTAPAGKPREKIDYILLPKDTPWQVNSAEVLDDDVSSDHLALLVELRSVKSITNERSKSNP